MQGTVKTKKNLAIIVVISLLAFILRINLPPNDIAHNLKLKENVGWLEGLTANTLLSQTIANWQITDLIVIKFAYSERLEMSLIALPFQKWQLLEKKSEEEK